MSRVSIGIAPGEFAALADELQRDVESIRTAATAAALETANWLRDRVADDMAGETGIAQSLFLRRVKKYVRTGIDARGRVFVGLFRAEASESNFGTLTQGADGARAGKYSFPGSFVATMPNGFRGIFRRTGKFGRRGNPRLERIAVERVELPAAAQLIARHELPAEVYFRRAFDARLRGVLA